MPELPEVETARRQVDEAAKGQKIAAVKAFPDKIVFDESAASKFKKSLEGAKVTGTDRRGKYFWLKLDRKPWPVIHFGMSGHVDIHKKDEKFKLPKSTKLELTMQDGSIIIFRDARRFGRIRLANDPLTEGAVSHLGYDPLFDFPKPSVLHKILMKRKAPIKAVLLDQSVFAGIGNWIADEVLYQAKISPHRLANSLSASEVSKMNSKILSIIRHAVKVGASHDEFPQFWLFHDRWNTKKDSKTFRGERITRETIAGRTAAWVPDVQK